MFNLFRLLENETYLVFGKDARADINLVEVKFAKLSREENNF